MYTTGDIRLYNKSGEEINSALLGITTESLSIDTVLIEANILPVKAFQLSEQINIQDKRVTSVRFSPETIRIAARSEVLEQLDSLPLDLSGIDPDNLDEGTNVITVRIQKPSEDAVLSNDTVIMTLEVTDEE